MNNFLQLLQEIFQVCIIPLLGVLTAYLVKYIQVKEQEITANTDNELSKKYIEMLSKTITECVIATNQTYVETLKNKNAFTKEAQQEAFKLTSDAVKTILSEDAKVYLSSIYGDLDTYITKQIEATVNANKTVVNA